MAKKKKKVKRRQKPDVGGLVEVVGSRSEWAKCGTEIAILAKTTGRDRVIRLRETISTEAKLPMPPVRIEPYAFVAPDMSGVIYGCVRPIVIRGRNTFTAVLPVATLIVADDTTLRRVLCHEFSHCFWHVSVALKAAWKGKKRLSTAGEGESKEEIFAHAVENDIDKLVNPAEWFGKWDTEHFLVEGDDTTLTEMSKQLIKQGILPGLPTKNPVSRFSIAGVAVAIEVMEHIRKLHNFETR